MKTLNQVSATLLFFLVIAGCNSPVSRQEIQDPADSMLPVYNQQIFLRFSLAHDDDSGLSSSVSALELPGGSGFDPASILVPGLAPDLSVTCGERAVDTTSVSVPLEMVETSGPCTVEIKRIHFQGLVSGAAEEPLTFLIEMQRDEEQQPIVTIQAKGQDVAVYQPIIETDQLDPNSPFGSLEIRLDDSGTMVVNQKPPAQLEDSSMPEDEMVCSPDPEVICRDGRCAENGFVMFALPESDQLFTLDPAYIEVRAGDALRQCLIGHNQLFVMTEDHELEYTWEQHLRPWERIGSCLLWSDEDYEIEIKLPAGQNLEFIQWRSLSKIEGNDVVRPCDCEGSTDPTCPISAQVGPQEAFGCVAQIGTSGPEDTCPDCELADEYLIQIGGMSGGMENNDSGFQMFWQQEACDCADIDGQILIQTDDLVGTTSFPFFDFDACQHRNKRADLCLMESYVNPGQVFGYYTYYGISIARSPEGWKLQVLVMTYYHSGGSSGSASHGLAVYETREFMPEESCDQLVDEPLGHVATFGPYQWAGPSLCQGWDELNISVTAVNHD